MHIPIVCIRRPSSLHNHAPPQLCEQLKKTKASYPFVYLYKTINNVLCYCSPTITMRVQPSMHTNLKQQPDQNCECNYKICWLKVEHRFVGHFRKKNLHPVCSLPAKLVARCTFATSTAKLHYSKRGFLRGQQDPFFLSRCLSTTCAQ